MAEPGLRERKKRETRQHISDVATQMFLAEGFDNVRVADVAEACGVSEKTVYNYFPNKESLALDQEEPMRERLAEVLGPGATEPPSAAMAALAVETIEHMVAHHESVDEMSDLVGKFMAMIAETPALAAARDAATKRLIDTGAKALAARYGRDEYDADVRVAAVALVGFWDAARIRGVIHLRDGRTPDEIRKLTKADMKAAAKLIHHGLDGSSFN
ncbi:MAG: TetR/AcrR family transcriptional regulator [Solirubrobacterales bacterium]